MIGTHDRGLVRVPRTDRKRAVIRSTAISFIRSLIRCINRAEVIMTVSSCPLSLPTRSMDTHVPTSLAHVLTSHCPTSSQPTPRLMRCEAFARCNANLSSDCVSLCQEIIVAHVKKFLYPSFFIKKLVCFIFEAHKLPPRLLVRFCTCV